MKLGRLGVWYSTDKLNGAQLADLMRAIESNGYSFLVEMLFRVQSAGARVTEHPIIYVERREGQSKMSKSVILESVFMPWRLRLAKMVGRL